MDEAVLLAQAREAAAACERASAAFAEFAERLSAVIGPHEMAEYDSLVARDAAARSDRVEAFRALGLGAISLEGE